jgi:hypothetical protein
MDRVKAKRPSKSPVAAAGGQLMRDGGRVEVMVDPRSSPAGAAGPRVAGGATGAAGEDRPTPFNGVIGPFGRPGEAAAASVPIPLPYDQAEKGCRCAP